MKAAMTGERGFDVHGDRDSGRDRNPPNGELLRSTDSLPPGEYPDIGKHHQIHSSHGWLPLLERVTHAQTDDGNKVASPRGMLESDVARGVSQHF